MGNTSANIYCQKDKKIETKLIFPGIVDGLDITGKDIVMALRPA